MGKITKALRKRRAEYRAADKVRRGSSAIASGKQMKDVTAYDMMRRPGTGKVPKPGSRATQKYAKAKVRHR